jgi:hypothetical protein
VLVLVEPGQLPAAAQFATEFGESCFEQGFDAPLHDGRLVGVASVESVVAQRDAAEVSFDPPDQLLVGQRQQTP